MTQIHKFSLVYDAREDRLAWDTETLEGATTRLWLTQRLCRGLVKALLPMLEKAAASSVPPEHEATLQAWEQAAAMAAFGQVPPVQPGADSASGLVHAVHITPSGDDMTLTFDFVGEQSRTVGVARPAMRQTLDVLYRLHVAAGWPLDIWPGWIAEPATAASTAVVN